MSESFGSRGEATEHLRRADTRWTEAVRTFHAYPDRLRRLAEAADTQRKAFMFADLCNLTWKPRENARPDDAASSRSLRYASQGIELPSEGQLKSTTSVGVLRSSSFFCSAIALPTASKKVTL